MKLEKYRDMWSFQYDWFWVDDNKWQVLSPYFPNEEAAMTWKEEQDNKQ